MATYFDPKSWLTWLDPVADLGAGTVTALLPDVLMTLLSEGILRQFGGREVSATLLGHRMTATLTTLKVRRRGAHFQTKTVLTGLLWNGHPIEEMTVIAHGVRLVPGVPTRVRAATLDVTGTVTTAAVADWLNDRQPDWELGVAADGLITARHRRRRLHALVDAVVADNIVTIAVHRATWLGISVPRRWIRPAPIPLSELPADIRIVRADRHDERISFRIEIPDIAGSFDLAQLRSAIVAGTTLIIF
ncbi:hypothetical protein NDR87_23885 [Nocardia sp. CDC159]|uniref:Uncharacterized protein n=1 Tax=Nocardia pulmonis TaxID=2951408 RepID=A0A9X2EB54_9NOCA|nr:MULTISPECIES: hypothetical protein [Nocardia]MCM6776990.1 hypothetical protein [Nocardia pulmonis]MCM6789414.1 hypothetical protein [Nocardia sp. CDC159]